MSEKFYTGVGSRQTPLYIMYMMAELAMIFEKKGFKLRSGCAIGADSAFEDALSDLKNAEIYIPNKGFPFKMGASLKKEYLVPKLIHGVGGDSLYTEAMRLIHMKDIYKGWMFAKPYVMELHNRNMFQVLGQDLKTPSKFTVCYTKGRELKYEDTTKKTGGTGTAINASSLYNVDVFNLSVDEHYTRLQKFINDNRHLVDYDRLNLIKPRSPFNEQNATTKKFNHTYEYFMEQIKKDKKLRDEKIASLKTNFVIEKKEDEIVKKKGLRTKNKP